SNLPTDRGAPGREGRRLSRRAGEWRGCGGGEGRIDRHGGWRSGRTRARDAGLEVIRSENRALRRGRRRRRAQGGEQRAARRARRGGEDRRAVGRSRDQVTSAPSTPRTRHGSRALSLAAVRSHFPALERTHNGYPVAYFDGPGGTQVPREVADAMSDYLLHH